MAVGQNQWDPILGVFGAPPNSGPILVAGLNRMLTGGQPIWILTHGQICFVFFSSVFPCFQKWLLPEARFFRSVFFQKPGRFALGPGRVPPPKSEQRRAEATPAGPGDLRKAQHFGSSPRGV